MRTTVEIQTPPEWCGLDVDSSALPPAHTAPRCKAGIVQALSDAPALSLSGSCRSEDPPAVSDIPGPGWEELLHPTACSEPRMDGNDCRPDLEDLLSSLLFTPGINSTSPVSGLKAMPGLHALQNQQPFDEGLLAPASSGVRQRPQASPFARLQRHLHFNTPAAFAIDSKQTSQTGESQVTQHYMPSRIPILPHFPHICLLLSLLPVPFLKLSEAIRYSLRHAMPTSQGNISESLEAWLSRCPETLQAAITSPILRDLRRMWCMAAECSSLRKKLADHEAADGLEWSALEVSDDEASTTDSEVVPSTRDLGYPPQPNGGAPVAVDVSQVEPSAVTGSSSEPAGALERTQPQQCQQKQSSDKVPYQIVYASE